MVSSKILRSEPSFDRALDAVKFLPILLVALLFCGPALRAQEVPTTTGPLTAQSSESWLVWVIGNWHLFTTPARDGTERRSKANS
jgi:hypothetical protein